MPVHGILAGMQVIELSAFVAVPYGCLTLAQLGADVIRVDPLGGGMDIGRWPVTDEGHSLYWAGLNKEKRSVSLDLRSKAGQALVERLITSPEPGGGIVVTNLSPEWLEYEQLRARRPDVIMVALSGNPDGSPAVDYTVNAAVGYPAMTGASSDPVNHVLPAWDLLAGSLVSTAVLAAERHRTTTGSGQLIELSLSDVALATVGHLGHLAEVELTGLDRSPYGNYVYGQFGRDFETMDGHRVMVVALTGRQWRALVEATNAGAQMVEIEHRRALDLAEEGDRFQAREEIAAILGPWFAARTLDEVRAVLDGVGVLWGPYQTVAEMLARDSRASTANPMLARVDQPGIGEYLAPRSPLRFGAVPPSEVRPAPVLGADTAEVLTQVLDLEPSEIERLAQDGVI